MRKEEQVALHQMVQSILKRVRMWSSEVQPFYEPLPRPTDSPGRAMTPEEERKLLQAGMSNPQWATVYWLTILSTNTAAGPAELVGLRREDVSLNPPETARIFIHEDAKNKYRIREVPLNPDAILAIKSLLDIGKDRRAWRLETI